MTSSSSALTRRVIAGGDCSEAGAECGLTAFEAGCAIAALADIHDHRGEYWSCAKRAPLGKLGGALANYRARGGAQEALRLLLLWPVCDERVLALAMKRLGAPFATRLRLLDWRHEGNHPSWRGGGRQKPGGWPPLVEVYRRLRAGDTSRELAARYDLGPHVAPVQRLAKYGLAGEFADNPARARYRARLDIVQVKLLRRLYAEGAPMHAIVARAGTSLLFRRRRRRRARLFLSQEMVEARLRIAGLPPVSREARAAAELRWKRAKVERVIRMRAAGYTTAEIEAELGYTVAGALRSWAKQAGVEIPFPNRRKMIERRRRRLAAP